VCAVFSHVEACQCKFFSFCFLLTLFGVYAYVGRIDDTKTWNILERNSGSPPWQPWQPGSAPKLKKLMLLGLS